MPDQEADKECVTRYPSIENPIRPKILIVRVADDTGPIHPDVHALIVYPSVFQQPHPVFWTPRAETKPFDPLAGRHFLQTGFLSKLGMRRGIAPSVSKCCNQLTFRPNGRNIPAQWSSPADLQASLSADPHSWFFWPSCLRFPSRSCRLPRPRPAVGLRES